MRSLRSKVGPIWAAEEKGITGSVIVNWVKHTFTGENYGEREREREREREKRKIKSNEKNKTRAKESRQPGKMVCESTTQFFVGVFVGRPHRRPESVLNDATGTGRPAIRSANAS